MEEALRFLIKFFAVASAIFTLWYFVGIIYQNFILIISTPVILLMGYPQNYIEALRLGKAYLYNFNLVPLITLALITPNKKRLKFFGITLIALIFLHVTDLSLHFPAYFSSSEVIMFLLISIPVFTNAIPFVFWFILTTPFKTTEKSKEGITKN